MDPFDVLPISFLWIARPLIMSVEDLHELFRKEPLEVTHKNNIVLAVEVNPAAIAFLGILALGIGCLAGIKYFVQGFVVYVAQHDV